MHRAPPPSPDVEFFTQEPPKAAAVASLRHHTHGISGKSDTTIASLCTVSSQGCTKTRALLGKQLN